MRSSASRMTRIVMMASIRSSARSSGQTTISASTGAVITPTVSASTRMEVGRRNGCSCGSAIRPAPGAADARAISTMLAR